MCKVKASAMGALVLAKMSDKKWNEQASRVTILIHSILQKDVFSGIFFSSFRLPCSPRVVCKYA